jgi:glycosyltransferase involved in cell wall biosynthesis
MANQTRQLAAMLSSEGCRVTLVAVNAPYRPRWIRSVRGLRALFRLIPYLFVLWRSMREVEIVHLMANSGWAWHLLAAPAIWIARLRRKPVVVNYRGGEAAAFLRNQITLVRPTISVAQAMVVPSRFLAQVFAEHRIRTSIVPNIVDLARFRPTEAVPGRMNIVVARNLEDIYDIPTALRAFSLVRRQRPQARLIVAGSGPRRASLETLCRSLDIGSAVTFTGRLEIERMADLYHAADVALNPSRVDNMPNSLLEAMASGVPIVSTDVGGVRFMVEDAKSALLVPPGDPQAMAAAILRLMSDETLAKNLRTAGLLLAQRYGWQNVREDWFDVYARVARKPGTPQALPTQQAT